jgi:hypothetical protein
MTTIPLSALTATWNASGTTFTGIGLNVTDTASAAASLLLDLQVGGAPRFSVSKASGAFFQTNFVDIRNGTTAQAIYIYRTYTDPSNYERIRIDWSGTTARISPQSAGTGLARNIELSSVGGTLTLSDGNASLVLQSGRFVLGNRDIEQLINIVAQTGYHEMSEMTAPAAPAANRVRIYAVDNGAGKTQLMAQFATGAAVQIAIEP